MMISRGKQNLLRFTHLSEERRLLPTGGRNCEEEIDKEGSWGTRRVSRAEHAHGVKGPSTVT